MCATINLRGLSTWKIDGYTLSIVAICTGQSLSTLHFNLTSHRLPPTIVWLPSFLSVEWFFLIQAGATIALDRPFGYNSAQDPPLNMNVNVHGAFSSLVIDFTEALSSFALTPPSP